MNIREKVRQSKKIYFYLKDVLGYTEEQSLTKNMLKEIKQICRDMNSESGTHEFTYGVLLEIFKIYKSEIAQIVKKEFPSDDDKFTEITNYIREKITEIFDLNMSDCECEYFNLPTTKSSVNFSTQIHSQIYKIFNEKLNSIKDRFNDNYWRTFTFTGALNTCLLAIARGLIKFEDKDGKIYLKAESGVVCSKNEFDKCLK